MRIICKNQIFKLGLLGVISLCISNVFFFWFFTFFYAGHFTANEKKKEFLVRKKLNL